jgi:AraC-like DNA-binding protein
MVANQLASLLPSGESRAAVVARQLGMSQRSLTRHLAEEGTTFGEILERLRQRLAARYLADDRMSVGFLRDVSYCSVDSEPAVRKS